MTRRFLLGAFASVALLTMAGAVTTAARAQTSYSFRDLGTLGGTYSNAQSVNTSGQVVGYAFRPGGTTFGRDEHAFYWASGVMTDLGTLGGTWAQAFAINNAGDVVGRSQIAAPGNTTRAFLWNNTSRVLTDLNTYLSVADAANWVLRSAAGINDNRQVTGEGEVSIDGVVYAHAYLLDLNTGFLTDLGTLPGSADSYGFGLNNLASPQVVGKSGVPFLYDSAAFALLDLSPLWEARGINNAGQIVGAVNPSGSGPAHPAYRAPDGTITDLGTFTSNSYAGGRAYGINNAFPAFVVGKADTVVKNTLLPRAFRWRVGSAAKDNLNTLASNRGTFTLRSANAVSDNGSIVGTANNTKNEPSNYDRAFLLTPQ